MPFFRKTKLTPNLHRPWEYRPHDVLEECLELECLIEDMKCHWRHEVWIYIYASTLPTFPMPYSHFPSQNPHWTQRNQTVNMPSTRSGRRYSTRTPMPSSSTLRQGSSPSSSSSSSSLIFRGLLPYRKQERIPDITLLEYGKILGDDDDYDDLMAILYPQSDLYLKTITMWHLWIMANKLRREADRQEIEARRIFIEMEGTGLQQVLCPHQNTPPRCSSSAAAWLPTPYYPAPEEIQPLEPVKQSPTPPTDITTTRRTRKPYNRWRQWWRVRWTRWWFLHSRIDLFHSSLVSPTLSRVYRLKTSIFQVFPIHLWPLRLTSTRTPSIWLYQSLKLVTSTIVGDIVTNSFSSLQHAYHAFTNSFSYMIEHAFPSRLTALYICLPYLYLTKYMCLPQGQHTSLLI